MFRELLLWSCIFLGNDVGGPYERNPDSQATVFSGFPGAGYTLKGGMIRS